jgi:hypothetical protein
VVRFEVFLHPHEPDVRIRDMTVGIGVICEGGKAAVVAADRIVPLPLKHFKQLFTISDATAVPANHQHIGFCTIGAGRAEAHVSLAWREYQTSWSLAEGVFGAYEAKRAAELAPGVGDTTDIAIISGKKRSRFLTASAIDELAKIYKESRKPTRLSESQHPRLARHLS